jgi:hydrogenase nickel incorporation protein HypA/HybF
MHEFSIAQSLIELAKRHVPPGTMLRRLVIEAGPLQGIDPEAMSWAWQAATDSTDLAGSKIELVQLPWRLRCGACGREWTAPELSATCSCGADEAHPVGGADLLLRTLIVDDPSEEQSDAGSGCRECAEAQR